MLSRASSGKCSDAKLIRRARKLDRQSAASGELARTCAPRLIAGGRNCAFVCGAGLLPSWPIAIEWLEMKSVKWNGWPTARARAPYQMGAVKRRRRSRNVWEAMRCDAIGNYWAREQILAQRACQAER